jgi:nucleotide-binding universal stress UspA family protein
MILTHPPEEPQMNILLATDGSRYAMEAASFLRSHLDPSVPLRIEMVAVLDPSGHPPASNGSPRLAEDTARQRAWAHRWLEDARVKLGPDLTPARSRILHGAPEDVLVREARNHDLVVAGVKGCGAAPFFELGRVARALLRHADCSVLLVRDPRQLREKGNGRASHARTTKDHEGPPRFTVLVATTDAAGDDPPAGWSLLEPFALSRASLEVVTVLERGAGANGESADGSGTSGVPTRRWLSRSAADLRIPSGEPRWALLQGRPGAEIERRALETGADLIVVGARRGSSPGAGPLGSTARELVWRAPCSVLTVRHRQVVPAIQVARAADLDAGISA